MKRRKWEVPDWNDEDIMGQACAYIEVKVAQHSFIHLLRPLSI